MMSIWEAGFYFAGCVALMGVMAVYNLGLRLPRWPRRMGTPLPRALARAALPEPEAPRGARSGVVLPAADPRYTSTFLR